MSGIEVAALFVRADGPYANRPDVDAWTVDRDARLYDGPWPVVAHPPCERWGSLWWSAQITRAGPRPNAPGKGDDGGCFAHALSCLYRFGGVLEHPERSHAWAHHGIPKPRAGQGWHSVLARLVVGWPAGSCRSLWTCSVDQSRYGHRAQKRTWLLWCGDGIPPALDFRPLRTNVLVCSGPGRSRDWRSRRESGVELLSDAERILTPPAFAEALIEEMHNPDPRLREAI